MFHNSISVSFYYICIRHAKIVQVMYQSHVFCDFTIILGKFSHKLHAVVSEYNK